jgi:hypothetical protein
MSMNTQRVLDPKPGSPEAVAQGCICPPQTGPDAVYDQNCPLHGAADRVEQRPDAEGELGIPEA